MQVRHLRLLGRAIAAVLLIIAVFWGGGVAYLWFNEPRFVFRSEFSRRADRTLHPAFTSVQLRTADGVQLDAVTLTAAEPDGDRPWVIYFQGNAGSLRRPRVQQHLQTLHGLGYDVLSLDYRGYGRSQGVPTEAGLYEDALAAYQHLRSAGVDGTRIILAGQSLGSAVAVELATRVASAGVALFSPIDSVPLTAGRVYPWVPAHWLATNRFDSAGKIARLRVPLVVFHSATDRLIPLQAARDLFAKATAPKVMFETGGGHNNAGFADPDALRAAFAQFWPATAAGESPGERWRDAGVQASNRPRRRGLCHRGGPCGPTRCSSRSSSTPMAWAPPSSCRSLQPTICPSRGARSSMKSSCRWRRRRSRRAPFVRRPRHALARRGTGDGTRRFRQWQFTPTLLNDQPVPIVMTVTVSFTSN